MDSRNVAFLGLGTMGTGMVSCLARAGFEVTAYNRTPSRIEPLLGLGVKGSARPKEAVRQASIVIVCVADDTAIHDVLFERDAISYMAEGSLLIDCSTTSLDATEAIHAQCLGRGIEFIDAPITGSKLGAESGNLTFMVGGPPSRVERAKPLFEAMGKHVIHAGERIGDGQRTKYCLNMTQAIVLQGVLEGYALAEAQGLSYEVMEEVLNKSAGKTGVGGFKTPFLKEGDFTPHFRLDLMQKDLHLALIEASAHRVPLPLARAIATVYDTAAQQGLGAEDFLATAKLLQSPQIWTSSRRRDLSVTETMDLNLVDPEEF